MPFAAGLADSELSALAVLPCARFVVVPPVGVDVGVGPPGVGVRVGVAVGPVGVAVAVRVGV